MDGWMENGVAAGFVVVFEVFFLLIVLELFVAVDRGAAEEQQHRDVLVEHDRT